MDLVQAIVAHRQRVANRRAWDTGYVQAAPVDGWVDVNCSGAIERVYCPSYVTPAAGDVVAVLRGGTPMVVGILATGDADNPEYGPPTPDGQTSQGVSRFPAQYSYSWEMTPDDADPSGGRFTYQLTDVLQGNAWPDPLSVRYGWWFYQDGPAVTIPGVTVDSVRMWLPGAIAAASVTTNLIYADRRPNFPSRMGFDTPYGTVLSPPSASDDAPDPTPITLDPGVAQWVDVPAAVGQSMVDSTLEDNPAVASGGIAIGLNGDDNVRVPGVQRDPTSGLLEITWHR